MTKKTLLLTPWYEPHNILTWEDAVTMKYEGTAEVVSEYDEHVCSPSVDWKIPAVMRLKKLPKIRKCDVKFSRYTIFVRDNFQCQYCLSGLEPSKLTIDHIVPRSAGGKTTWQNCCACCSSCNSKKGNRSCESAKMYPLNKPVKPTAVIHRNWMVKEKNIPNEWKAFIHRDLRSNRSKN